MRKLSLAVLSILGTLIGGPAFAQEPKLLHPFPGNSVYPESVTVDQGTGAFYVGSVKEGTIFRGQVGKKDVEIFSPAGADGRTMANGLFYAKGKLIVLGRQSGQIFVYDTKSGKLLGKMHNGLNGTEQTFLNDVVFTPDGSAYVTDSVNPVLYRVTATGAKYSLAEFMKFDGPEIKYVKEKGAPGINVNGIVATADGRYLLLAKRNENALFRLDLRIKQVTRVDLGQGKIETPDGMFLSGTTLYVAQNTPPAVAVLKMSKDFTQAKLERTISDESFAFPTAVARYKNKLLVVSAQFDTKGSPAAVSGDKPPQLPFWVTELPENGNGKQASR